MCLEKIGNDLLNFDISPLLYLSVGFPVSWSFLKSSTDWYKNIFSLVSNLVIPTIFKTRYQSGFYFIRIFPKTIKY